MSKYHLPSKHQFQDVIRLVTGCHRIFDSRWKKHIKAVCYQRLILYAVRLGGEQAVFSLQEMHNQNPKKHWAFLLSDSPLLQSSRASRHLQRPSQTPEKRGAVRQSARPKADEGFANVSCFLCKRLLKSVGTFFSTVLTSHLLSIAHCETILDFNSRKQFSITV